MTRDRIAVTGMGIVSALGWSLEETWLAIEKEQSGLNPLTLFESPRFGHIPVGEVKGDPVALSGLPAGSRTDHLAVYAAARAFEAARFDTLSEKQRKNAAVVLGCSTGGILDTEVFLERLMKEGSFDTELLRHHEAASPANQVAQSLGLKGFRTTVCTACAAGATAIATACDLIDSGEAQIVLAGGADSLARLTLNGFCSLLIVASDGCRPFDAERGGMSLGEGAAVLALETEESAIGRGADILGYVLGFGNTCDAYHATAPAPDGSGIFRAMNQALDSAGVSSADVDYINAHGTGTIDNDIAEGRGITRLFGEKPPPVSSTKRFFGHTLAAAGAIEAIVCLLALKRRCLPPNLGLRHTDPGVGFEPVRETREADLRVAMSNSMGFGGNNCSLILSRAEHE